MDHPYQPGDRVYWWKRVGSVEWPYRSGVLAVGEKRIKIAVEDWDGTTGLVRHVARERLQPVGTYFEKAADQGPYILEPAALWGRFTRYVEVAEDLHIARQVDVFENGYFLSYDRSHWADDFGQLGGLRINRNCKSGLWGHSEEIPAEEFERVWSAARQSPLWEQQVATAMMSERGPVPPWLTAQHLAQRWWPSKLAR